MNVNVRDLVDVELESPVAGRQRIASSPNGPRAASPASIQRRVKAPQRFNGIHRRRRKKIMW